MKALKIIVLKIWVRSLFCMGFYSCYKTFVINLRCIKKEHSKKIFFEFSMCVQRINLLFSFEFFKSNRLLTLLGTNNLVNSFSFFLLLSICDSEIFVTILFTCRISQWIQGVLKNYRSKVWWWSIFNIFVFFLPFEAVLQYRC